MASNSGNEANNLKEILLKLQSNLEFCGWNPTMDEADESRFSEFRKGQISIYRWLKKEANKSE